MHVHGTEYKEPDVADDMIDILHEKFPEYLSTKDKNRANPVIEPVYWAILSPD